MLVVDWQGGERFDERMERIGLVRVLSEDLEVDLYKADSFFLLFSEEEKIYPPPTPVLRSNNAPSFKSSFAMKFFYLATMAGATLALPQSSPRAVCTTPELRKSWAKATTAEKTAYLNAAVCVTKKPSRLNNGNSTLHDDFAFVHAKLFPQSMFSSPIDDIWGYVLSRGAAIRC